VEFEKDVAADLMVMRLSESGEAEIIANAIYSYDCIKSAATFVRMENRSTHNGFKI
jgi:hypothetical protein